MRTRRPVFTSQRVTCPSKPPWTTVRPSGSQVTASSGPLWSGNISTWCSVRRLTISTVPSLRVSASRLVCGLTGSHGLVRVSGAAEPCVRGHLLAQAAHAGEVEAGDATVLRADDRGRSAGVERHYRTLPGLAGEGLADRAEATFHTWTPVERVGHDLRATRDQRDPPNPRGRQIGGEGSVPAGAQVRHGDSGAAYWTRNEVFRPSATSRPSAEIAGRPPIGNRRRIRPVAGSHRIVSPCCAEVRSTPLGVKATCGSSCTEERIGKHVASGSALWPCPRLALARLMESRCCSLLGSGSRRSTGRPARVGHAVEAERRREEPFPASSEAGGPGAIRRRSPRASSGRFRRRP